MNVYTHACTRTYYMCMYISRRNVEYKRKGAQLCTAISQLNARHDFRRQNVCAIHIHICTHAYLYTYQYFYTENKKYISTYIHIDMYILKTKKRERNCVQQSVITTHWSTWFRTAIQQHWSWKMTRFWTRISRFVLFLPMYTCVCICNLNVHIYVCACIQRDWEIDAYTCVCVCVYVCKCIHITDIQPR